MFGRNMLSPTSDLLSTAWKGVVLIRERRKLRNNIGPKNDNKQIHRQNKVMRQN
jgi:hypothetical protein